MGKIVRQLGIKPQLLPGDGVDKAQRFGVQTLPVQAGDAVVGAVHRVPCHRVVNGCGRLVPSWPEQKALLEAEGVAFRRNGNVDMRRYAWNPDGAASVTF